MLRLQLIIEGKRGGCCREEGGTERLRRPHRDKLGTRGPSARSGGAEEAGAGRRGARWPLGDSGPGLLCHPGISRAARPGGPGQGEGSGAIPEHCCRWGWGREGERGMIRRRAGECVGRPGGVEWGPRRGGKGWKRS